MKMLLTMLIALLCGVVAGGSYLLKNPRAGAAEQGH